MEYPVSPLHGIVRNSVGLLFSQNFMFLIICILFPQTILHSKEKTLVIIINYYCSFLLAKLFCMSRVSNCMLQAVILVLNFMAMHPVNSTKKLFT
jgi:hypothetical protein